MSYKEQNIRLSDKNIILFEIRNSKRKLDGEYNGCESSKAAYPKSSKSASKLPKCFADTGKTICTKMCKNKV